MSCTLAAGGKIVPANTDRTRRSTICSTAGRRPGSGDPGGARRIRRGADPMYRQHPGQGPPLPSWRKRRVQEQAIGRIRGGRTTKIHVVVDGLGRIISFVLTERNRHDLPPAEGLVQPLPAAKSMLGDAAYDSDRFRTFLADRGTRAEIKQNTTRKRLHPFDKNAYRGRNVIEQACLPSQGLVRSRHSLRQTC